MKFLQTITYLRRLVGLEAVPSSWSEKLIAGAGGFLGIAGILWVNLWLLEGPAVGMIVASMGASAVLLFAVPHGPLSQPWPLVAGHMISALVGVTAAHIFADPLIAAPAGVGLAIAAMHLLRCIHPPGGATALTAVVGGPAIAQLGYGFLLTPVLLNVLVLLSVAVLFNYPFAWRRYPAALVASSAARVSETDRRKSAEAIDHGDLVYALSEIDSFIDVSEQDLLRIYQLATRHAGERTTSPFSVAVGACYSNGRFGEEWAVREVLTLSGTQPIARQVEYRAVAGNRRGSRGQASLDEFARWAAYPVERIENTWWRVDGR